MTFKQDIKFALNRSADLNELESILIQYKINGGKKEDAHLNLYELLQEADTVEEDRKLRELIDYTIGFSGTRKSFWDK